MKTHVEISSDSDGKLLIVDYLKGFSIFTIALMHLLYLMTSMPAKIITLSSIGGSGVHVFFICSGIGLYTSYLKKKTSYGEFLKKRFLKIYLPYIFIIFICFFIPWVYDAGNRAMSLLSHVFLFKMFIPAYEISFGEHFWFISTIFQLYALFIPMCRLKQKLSNNKLFAFIFCGISVAWWILCDILDIGSIRIWGSFCLQYIWEFALGFILAEAFFNHKKIKLNNYLLFALSVLGIGLQALMVLYFDNLKAFNDVPALIGYSSLALLLSNISIVKNICNKLSAFSYEYYLVHMLVFGIVFRTFKPTGLFLQCVVGCIAMIIALAVAYMYNKIIRLLNSRHKQSKTALN